MSVVHRITGYDRDTERLALTYDVPREQLDEVKELVALPSAYTQCLGSFPLGPYVALRLAGALRFEMDVDRYDWFIEPFAEPHS